MASHPRFGSERHFATRKSDAVLLEEIRQRFLAGQGFNDIAIAYGAPEPVLIGWLLDQFFPKAIVARRALSRELQPEHARLLDRQDSLITIGTVWRQQLGIVQRRIINLERVP